MTSETVQGEVSSQNEQSQANQNTQQTNKNDEQQETKSKEKSLAKEVHELFNAPRESIRESVKGYTEKYLHLPFEDVIPPKEETEEEEKKEGKKGKGKGKGKGKKKKGKEEEKPKEEKPKEEKPKPPESLRQRLKKRLLNALRGLKQGVKQGVKSFVTRKGPKLTKKAIESVPLPPTPYGEVERFVEGVIIEVPEGREKNLLMAFAMQAGMYGIAVILVLFDNIIGFEAPPWLPDWMAIGLRIGLFLLLIPFVITSLLMWFTLYLTTYSSISTIFANIANRIWSQANYHHTFSPRAIVYYALAMVLYMATAKIWVGIVAGYFLALPSFIAFTLIQDLIALSLIPISTLLIGQIIIGGLILAWALVTFFYLTSFFTFSILSMYWSRYITNSVDIHRLLAVWLILAVRELLAPQMAYLAVAGFAIYAGIQAALSVGTQTSNYRYLNMLPAVIILAVAPMGTVNMLSQTVIAVVDQAFQYMASYDKWNYLMQFSHAAAKWLLTVIPPW